MPMFILMDIVFIYDLTVNHRTTEDQARGMSDVNVIYSETPLRLAPVRCILTTASPLTGRAVNSIDLSKKNISENQRNDSKKNESSQKVLNVKLLSSKEKAIFTVEGKTVCTLCLFLIL